MKCKDCGNILCSHRTTNAEMDCYFENPENLIAPAGLLNQAGMWPTIPNDRQVDDWSSFRREAAKDILCALIARKDLAVRLDKRPGEIEVTDAICFADELIKQLKQE